MPDGSFSKEQVALAKQLQEGYRSSGTFRSQTAASQPSSTHSHPVQQPSRMSPVTQPVRTQRMTAPRPVNGLVRPLSARDKADISSPVPKASGIIRTPCVDHTLGASQTARKPDAPAGPVSQPAQQTAPVVQFFTQRPANMPPSSQPFYISAEPRKAAPATGGHARQVSQNNTELLKTAFQKTEQARPVARADAENVRVGAGVVRAKTPPAVREAIHINKMGKPIKWNWMTENPVVREPNPEEMEEPEPLPSPGPSERVPWTRAWHPYNQPLKAPGLGSPTTDANDRSQAAPAPVIGLKGSRHAWFDE